MKKFYVICLAAIVFLGQKASAQTYTAIFSGNWSDPSNWGASGVPSNPCTGCTVTINDGVSITVDISFTLTGNGSIFIGSSGAFASSVNIPTTNAGSIFVGHNIILRGGAGNPKIKIVSAVSSLALTHLASTTGAYDGVFLQNPVDFAYSKILGLAAPSPSLIGSDGVTVAQSTGAVYGPSLPSGAHPAPFTIEVDGTLPVLLASFDAELNKGSVSLSWSTTQEVNSGYFLVQRSSNASDWQGIGTVGAKGTSNVLVNYSFSDASPSGSVEYYRLLIMDKDGKYKFSPVKAVRLESTTTLRVFPNPASNFVSVTLSSDMTADLTIRLINQSGQVLHEKKLSHAAGTTVSIPVQNFPQGNYILQMSGADGKNLARSFVITR
ncbi:MAG TPA: T9SS type A sorting domain-containing protein [Puia sp.]|nr:T9SS type A sorting domain-containing protein [Puia sp.]